MIDGEHKTLVLMVTYYFKETALKALSSLSAAVAGNDRFQVVVIDNNSQDGLREELVRLQHPRFSIRLLQKNIGKAGAVNTFTRELLDAGTVPDAIISMDGDITFSKDSLLLLDRALRCISNAGMISMRYEDNGFSPELNLPEQATQYLGRDQSVFSLRTPRFANVAGGVFGITGDCFKTVLQGQVYPSPPGKVYCSDDRALYQKLRDAGLVNGYLEGTCATHHGEGNYLFGDSQYSRWKQQQLKSGGSSGGYFEMQRSGLQRLAWNVRKVVCDCAGRLIASGLVPAWLQRKKRKRLQADSENW
jgi:GT2 family glycosyltransferase